MIVLSGVLVLVALVLLIIGVVGPDLTFVYASIGVSLVSLVFLVIGILQRRGETATTETAEAPGPDVTAQPSDDVTAVVPAQARAGRRGAAAEPVAEPVAEQPSSGTVLVVEGRPRYHVAGCRYLAGKSAEGVDVAAARDEGFSPCGVCKPDDALAAAPVEQPAVAEPTIETAAPEVVAAAPARGRTATRAVKAPAKAARKAPAKAAPAASPARKASKAPVKAAVKAPGKAVAAATAASPATASAAGRPGSVVVIPDRGKFHKAECRYVRDVDGAEVLSKTAATRQGYAACGVCKP